MRKKKQKKERKTQRIIIRMTPSEKQKISTLAKESNMTMSRMLMLGWSIYN